MAEQGKTALEESRPHRMGHRELDAELLRLREENVKQADALQVLNAQLDGTEGELKQLESEADALRGQVAALVAAGQRVMDCIASEALTGRGQPGLGAVAGLQLALTDTASAALSHDAAMRRAAIDELVKHARETCTALIDAQHRVECWRCVALDRIWEGNAWGARRDDAAIAAKAREEERAAWAAYYKEHHGLMCAGCVADVVHDLERDIRSRADREDGVLRK